MPFIYGYNAYEGVYIMNDIYKEIDSIINIDKKEEEKTVKKVDKQEYSLDTIQEQIESPMTSIRCPESIKEKELKLIYKKPENYIEINFIKIHCNNVKSYFFKNYINLDFSLMYIIIIFLLIKYTNKYTYLNFII